LGLLGRELFQLLLAALPDLPSLEQAAPLLLMAARVPAWRPPLAWFLFEALRVFRLGRRAFLVFETAGLLAQHARAFFFFCCCSSSEHHHPMQLQQPPPPTTAGDAVRGMGVRLLREVDEALDDMPELEAALTACRDSVAASLLLDTAAGQAASAE
jgi:hypothetical protein